MTVADRHHELATHLLPSLASSGFKYVKSRRAFQRTTKYGRDIIDLLNSKHHVYFGFGVRHEAVQKLLSEWGSGFDETSATVCQNSLNVHPNRLINFGGPTFWEFSPTFDSNKALSEASCLVAEVILPWLEKFGDPAKLRQTLANNDGWVISLRPWEVVAALDILAGRDQELSTYLAEQKKLAVLNKWVPDRIQMLASFSEMISSRLSGENSQQASR